MSAKQLKETIPGYSVARWGPRGDDALPPSDRYWWGRRILEDIRLKRNEDSLETRFYKYPSIYMHILIRDLYECMTKRIPFKSTNTELSINEDKLTGNIYAKGVYIATVELGNLVTQNRVVSFTIPESYHKYQLFLLRHLKVYIYKEGRNFVLYSHSQKIGIRVIIKKGINNHVRISPPSLMTKNLITNGHLQIDQINSLTGDIFFTPAAPVENIDINFNTTYQ